MSTPNPAEVIAEALAKHQKRYDARGCDDGCLCGASVFHKDFAAHQASVVAALPDIEIVPLPSDPGDEDYWRWTNWHTATEKAFGEALLAETRRIVALGKAANPLTAGGES